jgi:hypothetical protein
MRHTPEYEAWSKLIQRTTNPRNAKAESYSGRGIDLDPRYIGRGGFRLFFSDVGPRPGPDFSIDRIDNDRGYWPGNLRWATRDTQHMNRRVTRKVEWRGRVLTLRDACKEAGHPYDRIKLRLRRGWSVERALETA